MTDLQSEADLGVFYSDLGTGLLLRGEGWASQVLSLQKKKGGGAGVSFAFLSPFAERGEGQKKHLR